MKFQYKRGIYCFQEVECTSPAKAFGEPLPPGSSWLVTGGLLKPPLGMSQQFSHQQPAADEDDEDGMLVYGPTSAFNAIECFPVSQFGQPQFHLFGCSMEGMHRQPSNFYHWCLLAALPFLTYPQILIW